MIVFLDFDGVLHPENVSSQAPLLCRLPLVEEVLREFTQAEIVISSSWRLRWQDPEVAAQAMRKHFSADIALRVSGSEAETKVAYHEPLIRNQLIELFSQQTQESLATLEAKEALRQEALRLTRQVLEQEEGQPLVEDLLFNNLIVQP